MTTTPNMSLVLPTDHDSSDLWGAMLNTLLGLVDSHTHVAGKGLQVPSLGIGINADLTFASFAAINMKAVDFAAAAAANVTGYAGALFMSDGTGGLSANELYWRTTGGTNVKVTAGTALNVGAFTGGIGGDYTAVAAAAAYDDAGKRYTWKESTADANGWARMAHGEMRIFPTGGTGTFYVGQAVGALAGSYTMTWPLVLPGSTVLAQVDNTGAISFSNTIINDVTMSVNKSVTVSGTGELKHGTRTIGIHGVAFTTGPGTTVTYSSGGTPGISFVGSILVWFYVPLRVGDRVLAVRFFIGDSAIGPTKLQGSFASSSGTAGTSANIASTAVSSGAGAFQTLSITGLTTTLVAGTLYSLTVQTTTGTNFQQLIGAEVDYDHP